MGNPFCCHKAFGDMAPSSSPMPAWQVPTIPLTQSKKTKNNHQVNVKMYKNVTLPPNFRAESVCFKKPLHPRKKIEACAVFVDNPTTKQKKNKNKKHGTGLPFFGSRIPFFITTITLWPYRLSYKYVLCSPKKSPRS